MKASILTIGDELLAGITLDSNATWIGRKLMDLGIKTVHKLTVPDDTTEIVEAFKLSQEKGDITICTGGLGPTNDDITLKSFCEYTGSELQFDEDYYGRLINEFERRGYKMSETNRNQALIPDKGQIIPNPKGSARGVQFEKDGKTLFILPGVPGEMKTMMEETILPYLESLDKDNYHVINLRTTGLIESALFEMVSDLVENSEMAIAFIPGFTGVDIRLTTMDETELFELVNVLYDRIGNYIYAENWDPLEKAVGLILSQVSLTIAVAESCTGGLLADRITNNPGSSNYFFGGAVTYSNESKMNILGVKKATLEKHGAVSSEVAEQMAKGVRKKFKSDIGVGITGIAGPTGGSKEKPVGLTFIGLDVNGEVKVKKAVFTNDRRYNKELAVQSALNLVRIALL